MTYQRCTERRRRVEPIGSGPGSGDKDRGGERQAVVLGPRWTQSCSRTVEHLVRSFTQDTGRFVLNVLCVVEVNRPAAFASDFAKTLQYMTESARLSYGARRWTAMSSGKSAGQPRTDIETIGSGDAVASSSSAVDVARSTDARTSATSAARASPSIGSADR